MPDFTKECIVMVDVSYYEKYAANAVWKTTKEDNSLEDDENFDPMTLNDFKERFSWYFNCGLTEIVSKYYPVHNSSNYLFCMDSKRSDIWRRSIFPGYKHKRDVTKLRFSYSSISDWVEQWVKNHSEGRHSRYIKVNGSEADDIFSVMVKYLKNKYPEYDIMIISGDSDLLQLGGENIIQIDSHGVQLTIEDRLKKDGVVFDPTPLNYLQYKILIGDTSDDIPSIKKGKCGPKFASKLVRNKQEMVEFIKSDKRITENFMMNAQLIDLSKTPKFLCESILNEWNSFDEI